MFPHNVFASTIGKFSKILVSLGIRYHLTGGITSVVYGEPRLTQDIDVVVDPVGTKEQVASLSEQLEKTGFLFHFEDVERAVSSGGMFQIFDSEEILKVDVYVREMIPGELSRSETFELFPGMNFPIVNHADAALSKLVWIRKGSHKSRQDFRKIFASASLDDKERIIEGARQMNLETLRTEVLAESDELR